MKRWIVLLLVMMQMGSLRAQETPAATEDPVLNAPRGSISGTLSNGTAASTVPANTTVNLLISSPEGGAQQLQTQTDATNSFTFSEVPLVEGYAYTAVVIYREYLFSSETVFHSNAQPVQTLPVTIYDLTEDRSVISILSTVLTIRGRGEAVEVQQVIRFRNASDRVYTTTGDLGDGRRASLVVPLPPGAQVISFDNEQRYAYSQSTFTLVDTAPVYPGDEHYVIVVYILPYDGTAALLEQRVDYPFSGEARVLLDPDTLDVSSAQVTAIGEQTVGDSVFEGYGGNVNLLPGEVLTFELSGTTTAINSTGGGTSNVLPILTAVIAVLLMGIGVLMILRGQKRRTGAVTIDSLVRRIEQLDQQHARGQLAHDLWHQQKRELQDQLNRLLEGSTPDAKG
jgi:hypothetical protein